MKKENLNEKYLTRITKSCKNGSGAVAKVPSAANIVDFFNKSRPRSLMKSATFFVGSSPDGPKYLSFKLK